jgi:hypothetical protein
VLECLSDLRANHLPSLLIKCAIVLTLCTPLAFSHALAELNELNHCNVEVTSHDRLSALKALARTEYTPAKLTDKLKGVST